MKIRFLLLRLIGFFLLSQSLFASHFMGVDVTYECLGPCTYRIYHSTYYDCSGGATTPLPGPPPAPFINFIGTPGGCNAPIDNGNWIFVSYDEVTPICPGAATGCTQSGANINGVVGGTYYQDVDVCSSNCTSFQIQWSNCCRNYAITSGAGGSGIYTDVTTITPGLAPCNNSPVFANPPVPYLCAGQDFTFNQGAADVDGDSLSYSIGDCLQGQASPVPYNAGYSGTSPLGPTWNVAVDPVTGDVSIIANPGNNVVGVLCLFVTEWRNINGVMVPINEVERDIQITVISCGANTVPSITQLTNPNGCTVNGFTVDACLGQPFCFDIPTVDPDLNQQFTLSWNQNILGATFTDANNPAVQNVIIGNTPPTGQFCWTPPVQGVYTFLMSIEDNACPILGQNQYTVTINVTACSLTTNVNTDISNCYDVEFTADPVGGNPPYTYAWTGFSPNPGNVPSFTYSFPGPGLYNYSLEVTDATGNTDLLNTSINVVNTAVANAGPDITLCNGQTTLIGTPALPGYTYQWVANPPGVGFVGPTNVAQPTVGINTVVPTQITYTVTATDPNGCQATDAMVFSVNPPLQANISSVSPICAGGCSQIQYAGTPPVGAIYVWNFGGGVVQNGPAVGPGPYTVCYNTVGTANVTLSVQVPGCDTANAVSNIVVSPLPTTTFTATNPICDNQCATVTYTGTAAAGANFVWNWDGGAATGTGAGPYTVCWTNTGTHNITLQSVDYLGCISAQSTTIPVLEIPIPTAQFAAPDSVCAGDIVQVLDTNLVIPGAVYNWDFGGGIVVSGNGAGPYEIYWTTPGPHNICLQIDAGACSSPLFCRQIEVMPKPVAQILPVANQCFAGNSFDFVYNGVPGIDAYYWDFGDGAMPPFGNMANPTNIVYTTDGPKEVTLVVVKNGCVSDTARVNFLVAPMPHADFIAGSVGACLGDTIGFHYVGPTVTPNLQVYSWDFGPCSNPVSSSLQNPGAVQFNCAGPQTITLIVDNLGCKDTMTQTIQIHAGPIVDAGLPQSYCEGEGPADLNGSVSGGTQPWFYSWWCAGAVPCALSSPYVEDPQANPTASNLYYFQVEDANGCRSNIDTVTVQIKEKPIVDAGRDTAVCKPAGAWGVTICGEVVNNGTVPGPYTWEWTPLTGIPGQNNTQCIYIRPDTTTTYTLVVTAGNGCTSYWPTLDSLSTVTVLVHNMPIVEAGPDSMICMGETIQLLGNVTGAGPDYTYAWTPSGYPGNVVPANALNPNATPAFTTTYTLSATSNGCTASDTMRIVVRNLPTAEAGDILEICQGQSIQLNGVCAGDPYPGAECNQSWTVVSGDLTALPIPNDVFNPTVSPNVTTVYELTVSSERCQGTSDQVTVQVFPYPQVNVLDDDTLICAGVSVDLEGTHVFAPNPSPGPVVYHWYPSDNTVSDVFSPTPTVTPVQSTMYVLEVSTAGKCPGRDSVRISVMPAINASILADTTTICGGESTVLHAQGGLGSQQWTWTPALGLDKDDIKDPTATPPAGSTTYQVVIQEGFCKDSAQVTITVHPQPSADYFSTNQQACDNMEVSFLEMAENEIAYIWNFGDNSPVDNTPNPTHTYSQPGTYYPTLTVIGKGGCSDQVNVGAVTVTDLRFANFISNPDTSVTIVLPDGKVVFTDLSTQGTSWSWDFGDGKVSGERNPTHEYTAAGEYTVTLTVTNADGCVDKVVKTPYKVIAPGLFTPNVFTPNGDGIHDTWQIGYNGVERFAVVVYDRWGRKHFEADSPTKSWDGKDAKEGVYYYTIKVGDKVWNGYVTLMR